jgi:hypothetical protein
MKSATITAIDNLGIAIDQLVQELNQENSNVKKETALLIRQKQAALTTALAADAAAANIVDLTDSTGLSGSHNDTLAAVTTFTPSVAWNGSSVYPSAADATAIATAITTLNQNASDSAQKIKEIIAVLIAKGIIAAA